MSGAATQDDGAAADEELPLDFVTFAMSLVTHARLGLDQGGAGGDSLEGYVLACQTLDILRLLEQKTRGNLTGHEERVLVDLIDELDGSCRACRHAKKSTP